MTRDDRILDQLGQGATGTDAQATIGRPLDGTQLGQATEADQDPRHIEPELHVDQQIGTPGEDPGLFAMLGEQRQPLGEAGGSEVFESR